MNKYKLIIFDMDGTLADRDTAELLPNVYDKLNELDNEGIALHIATNQGGVGLRYWMEQGGFGEPEKYPTEEKVREHIDKVIEQTGIDMYANMCFRYQGKKGDWSPLPNNDVQFLYWCKTWRKPYPEMLYNSMRLVDVTPEESLMVGDSPEDEEAAKRAGCDFMWAWDFFEREKPE